MNIRSVLANATHAFKKNLIPGVILQIIAISLGISYYFWPAAMPAFSFFANLKAEYGIFFAMISTALFGGLIPFCILYLTGKITFNPRGQLLFYVLFWCIKGAEVDLFYRLQGHIFGISNDWQTALIKTGFDQVFYGSLWMVPSISLAYLWKECNFDFKEFRNQINRTFVFMTLPTIIISNWFVWLPAIVVIYMMPPNLQVPLYNLVQCFFVLLLAILAKGNND
ncbi:hypothetical protein [Desulfosediminicola flagellatus]|uniref:hypothetical protein n=1 Tax=Desulfosediminicola flagellatus TaxID=2569541 RepID=UPI0010AB6837|nr:hypothetical protein [Desulfosediminicola flagellatus]